MEQVAYSYLERGDAAAAASVFATLGTGRPKFARMARLTRVVADPASVPLPHRHADIAEAILERQIPLRAFAGAADTTEKLQKVYQRLLLAVHPDKNPHPRAAEAFIHLQGVKEAFAAIADEIAAERSHQEKQAEEYTRLTSTPPPPPPASKTPIPEKKIQPQNRKPAVPKKKQLESVLNTLKAHGSKKLTLQCNLSLSAFEQEKKQQQQQDSTDAADGDDDDEETLLCTVSSVSVRSFGDSLRSPGLGQTASSSSSLLQKEASSDAQQLRPFSLKSLKASASRDDQDKAAANAILNHVLQKAPIGGSTAGANGKGSLGDLSFKDMLQNSAAGGEIRLFSLRHS